MARMARIMARCESSWREQRRRGRVRSHMPRGINGHVDGANRANGDHGANGATDLSRCNQPPRTSAARLRIPGHRSPVRSTRGCARACGSVAPRSGARAPVRRGGATRTSRPCGRAPPHLPQPRQTRNPRRPRAAARLRQQAPNPRADLADPHDVVDPLGRPTQRVHLREDVVRDAVARQVFKGAVEQHAVGELNEVRQQRGPTRQRPSSSSPAPARAKGSEQWRARRVGGAGSRRARHVTVRA